MFRTKQEARAFFLHSFVFSFCKGEDPPQVCAPQQEGDVPPMWRLVQESLHAHPPDPSEREETCV